MNPKLVATALAANMAVITSAIALDQSLLAYQAVGDVTGKIKSVGSSQISDRLIVTLPKA
jgi:carbon monoxide dehydrogenase subunit G